MILLRIILRGNSLGDTAGVLTVQLPWIQKQFLKVAFFGEEGSPALLMMNDHRTGATGIGIIGMAAPEFPMHKATLSGNSGRVQNTATKKETTLSKRMLLQCVCRQ
jgi:hypothetical protein